MLDSIEITHELFDVIPNNIDRAFFVLHYYWGMTTKEIAYAFNTEEGLIKIQLQATKKIVEQNYGS